MKTLTRMTCVFVLISFLSSCGVITKTRYGNGLKLNVKLNVFKNDETSPGKTRERLKPLPVKAKHSKTNGQTFSGSLSDLTPLNENPAGSELELMKEPEKGSVTKGEFKTFIKKKLCEVKQQVKSKVEKIIPPKPEKRDSPKQIEPHIHIGTIVFYSALLVLLIAIAEEVILSGLVILLLIACLVFGFVMSLLGLRKIRNSDGKYGGIGLALSMIIMFGICVAITLLGLLIAWLISG